MPDFLNEDGFPLLQISESTIISFIHWPLFFVGCYYSMIIVKTTLMFRLHVGNRAKCQFCPCADLPPEVRWLPLGGGGGVSPDKGPLLALGFLHKSEMLTVRLFPLLPFPSFLLAVSIPSMSLS